MAKEEIGDEIIPSELIKPLLNAASDIQNEIRVKKANHDLDKELGIELGDLMGDEPLTLQEVGTIAAKEGTSREALIRAYAVVVKAKEEFENTVEDLTSYTPKALASHSKNKVDSILKQLFLPPLQKTFPEKMFSMSSRILYLDYLAKGLNSFSPIPNTSLISFYERKFHIPFCLASFKVSYDHQGKILESIKPGDILQVTGTIFQEEFLNVNRESLLTLKQLTFRKVFYEDELDFHYDVKQSFYVKEIK